MSAAIAFYDVRYRVDGSEEDWTQIRFPVDADIVLRDVVRGADYLLQIRSVSAEGRVSEWVDCPVSVPTTNKEGQFALPGNVLINQASGWSEDAYVEYTAETVGGDSEATISVAAMSLVAGDQEIPYDASSATVAGTPGTSRLIYLYYDDPSLEGGTRTLGTTPIYAQTLASTGRVAIGAIEVEFPAALDPPTTGSRTFAGDGGSAGARIYA